MDFGALADFNLVATHGGLGRASRASGQPKATLSRHIASLEDSLGVRLLERGPRSLRLTEQGAALFMRTEGLLKEVTETAKTISANLEKPHGRLRVSAPVLISHIALGRVAAGFARAYPEVQLEIIAEDRFVDPVEDGYDIVIRTNPAPDERLIGRCIIRDEMLLVAAMTVDRPVCAASHTVTISAVVLTAAPFGAVWQVRNGQKMETFMPRPVLRLSSLLMVRDAVLTGAGAALLPRSMVGGDVEAGRLLSWGTVADKPVSIWALHTSRRHVSKKVTAFIEYLTNAFPEHLL